MNLKALWLATLLTIGANEVCWQEAKKEIQERTAEKVFITIDDWPTKYTQEIVDSLESMGHSATFFLIGSNIKESYFPALQKADSIWIEFGNHSNSHPNFKTISLSSAKKEVLETDKKINEAGIQSIPFFRYPYGSKPTNWNKTNFENFLKENGHIPVLWTIDTRDRDKRTTKEVLKRNLANIKAWDIILIHDRSYTAKQTLVIIDSVLKTKGLKWAPLSEKFNKD